MQTEGLVTNSAVEMDVEVVVVLTGGLAEFIAHAVSGIFQHVHQMGVTEKGKGAENAAFIYRLKPPFQLHKGQRTPGR